MPHARRVLALAKLRFELSFTLGVGLGKVSGVDGFKNAIEFPRLLGSICGQSRTALSGRGAGTKPHLQGVRRSRLWVRGLDVLESILAGDRGLPC
jgi:hypothetical protein